MSQEEMDENKRLSTKVVTIPTDPKNFFLMYLDFIRPAHRLSPKQMKVLSLFMYKNFIELDNFKYEKDRWKKVFDRDSKVEIMDEVAMGENVFRNLMSTLKKAGALIKEDGVLKIAKSFLPSVGTTTEAFTLSLNFKIKNEANL